MNKIIFLFLILVVLIAACKPQEDKDSESVCGNDVCDDEDEESSCAADCGGFGGITNKQCEQAGGKWNDCGSPCAGTDAEACIQVCSAQCECGDIAGFNCPVGYGCRLSGTVADEIGVCIEE